MRSFNREFAGSNDSPYHNERGPFQPFQSEEITQLILGTDAGLRQPQSALLGLIIWFVSQGEAAIEIACIE